MSFELPSFIEVKERGWTVYLATLGMDGDYEYIAYDSVPQKRARSDPLIAEFRTHTELFQGSDLLLQNCNLLNFELVERHLDYYLHGQIDCNQFIGFATGYCFFSYNQMLTALDYNEYQNCFPKLLSITEKIINASMKLLNDQNLVFCEKGKEGVNKGWAELGKLIEIIFSDPDSCEDYKLGENLALLKHHLSNFNISISYNNIAGIILDHCRKGSCLRFFYSFKIIFNFIQPSQNEVEAENFLNYLKSLGDVKFYDLDISLEILQKLSYGTGKWSEFLTVNLLIFIRSEKLIQKKRILEFVCQNLNFYPEIPSPKEVLIKCFDHESLPILSILLIQLIVNQGSLVAEDFKHVYESIKDNIVLIEYFNTFVLRSKPMNDELNLSLLEQLNSSQVEGKEMYLEEVVKTLKSHNIPLHRICQCLNNFNLIIKSLPFEKPYLIELNVLKKFTAVSVKDESVIQVLSVLVESCNREVLKELDEKLSIFESILFQLKFDHSVQQIKKTAETLNRILIYDIINKDNFIGIIFEDAKIFSALAEYLFEWIKTDLFDNNLEKIYERLESLVAKNKSVSLDAMFNVYKKLNKNKIKYHNSVVLYTTAFPVKGLENLLTVFLTQSQSESEPEILKFIVRIGRTSFNAGQKFFNSCFESLIERHVKINLNRLSELVFLLAGVDINKEEQVSIRVRNQIYQFRGSDTIDEVKVTICEKLEFDLENTQFHMRNDARCANDLVSEDIDAVSKGKIAYRIEYYCFSDCITKYLLTDIKSIIKYINEAQVKKIHLEMSLFEALPYVKRTYFSESCEDFETLRKYLLKYLDIPLISQYFLNISSQFKEKIEYIDLQSDLLTAFFTVSKAENYQLDSSFENKVELEILNLKIDSNHKLIQYLDSILTLKKNFIIDEKSYFYTGFFTDELKKFTKTEIESTPTGGSEFLPIINSFFTKNFKVLLRSKFFEQFWCIFMLFSSGDKSYDYNHLKKNILRSNEFSLIESGYKLKNCTIILRNINEANDQLVDEVNNWLFNVDSALFRSVDNRKEAIFLYYKLNKKPNISNIVKSFEDLDNSKYFKKSLNNQSQLQKINFLEKGIRNHGNTCYINSVLQVLLMIDPIVSQIFEYQKDDAQFKAFQNIFLKLKFSILSSVRSKKMVKTFILNGNNINLGEQLDAEEFLVKSLEFIEKNTGVSGLQQLKTCVTSESYCETCKTQIRDKINEEYYVIPLDIVNKGSIKECFESFISVNHVSFPKTSCCNSDFFVNKRVNDLSRYLIFRLSRFAFNNTEYRTEKIYQKIRLNRSINYNKDHFKLVSFIVHIGNAENGHYVTFKKKKQYWTLLNDESVTYFDKKNFDLDNFFMLNETLFVDGEISTPYILLYEKKNNIQEIDWKKYKNEEIKKKNSQIFECFTFFSPDFISFIKNLVKEQIGIEFAVDYLFKVGFFLENSDDALENLLVLLESSNVKNEFKKYFTDSKNFQKIVHCFVSINDPKMIKLLESTLRFCFFNNSPDYFQTKPFIEYIKTLDHRRLDLTRILNLIFQESKSSTNETITLCGEFIDYHIKSTFEAQLANFNVFIIKPTNFSFLYKFLSLNDEIFSKPENMIIKNFWKIIESMAHESEFSELSNITYNLFKEKLIDLSTIEYCLKYQKFELVLGFLENIDEGFENFYDLINDLFLTLPMSKYKKTIEVFEKIQSKCDNEKVSYLMESNLDKIRKISFSFFSPVSISIS